MLMNVLELLKNEEQDIAVVVSLDRKLFNFLKRFARQKNITFFLFGNASVYRFGFYRPIRLIYTAVLGLCIPRLNTKELILTYGNWTDIGSIYLRKFRFERILQLVVYEENRYKIFTSSDQKMSLTHKYLNLLYGNFLEKKDYISNVNGTAIVGKGTGLKDLNELNIPFKKIFLDQWKPNKMFNYGFQVSNEPFVLFIDKDIITPGFINFRNYILLMKDLKRELDLKRISIYIKFKPRHYSFFKHLVLVGLGYKIALTGAPAQIYALQSSCQAIIGFTSSSMAINYGIPIISLSNLKNYYLKSMFQNVESMKQRNINGAHIIHPKHINEISDKIPWRHHPTSI